MDGEGYIVISSDYQERQRENSLSKPLIFVFLGLFAVAITCCLLLILTGWHGDLIGRDSDFKTKINIWILLVVIIVNYLSRILYKDSLLMLSSALVFTILPETAFITHYNVVNGYLDKSFLWVIFQITILLSFIIVPLKRSSKPLLLPYVHILGVGANILAFILLAVHAWRIDYWISPPPPQAIIQSPFGLPILILLYTFAYIASLFNSSTALKTATLIMCTTISIFIAPYVGKIALLSAGCVFACIGCLGFGFYIATILYKATSSVFGMPAIDTDGTYQPPKSPIKANLCRVYGVIAILSLIFGLVGGIMYLCSRVPGIPVLFIILLVAGVISNFLPYVQNLPRISTGFCLSVSFAVLPDVIPLALFHGTTITRVGIIMLSIGIVLSLIPHIQKIRLDKRISSILILIFCLILLATSITTTVYAKDQNCWTEAWNGISPFSCTLWSSGNVKDRYLSLAVPIALLAPLALISAVNNIKEWYYICLFMLSVQMVNQIQPILQQTLAFELTQSLSLSLICSSFFSLVTFVVLNNLRVNTQVHGEYHVIRGGDGSNCIDLDIVKSQI